MSDLTTFFVMLGCKVSLILGAAVLLILSSGRRWPLFCTAWQRSSIVAVLILPLAICFAPTVSIPVLSSRQTVESPPVREIERQFEVETSFVPMTPAVPSLSWAEFDVQTASEFVPVAPPAVIDAITVSPPIDIVSVEAVEPSVAITTDVARPAADWTAVLFVSIRIVYLAIAGIFLIRLFAAWLSLISLRRTSERIETDEWQSELATWTDQLQIRRRVDLLASDRVSVPMTFGWLRPAIIVPRKDLASYRPVEREAILVHELNHIARHDFFWQVVTQAAFAAYWWHPLAWSLRRSSDNLRERVCDLFCAHLLGQQRYAKALIAIAAQSQGVRTAGLGMAMAHRSSLGRRLDELKALDRSPTPKSGRGKGAMVCSIAILFAGAIVIGKLAERSPEVATFSENTSQVTLPETGQIADEAGDSISPEHPHIDPFPLINDGLRMDEKDRFRELNRARFQIVNLVQNIRMMQYGDLSLIDDTDTRVTRTPRTANRAADSQINVITGANIHSWFGIPLQDAEEIDKSNSAYSQFLLNAPFVPTVIGAAIDSSSPILTISDAGTILQHLGELALTAAPADDTGPKVVVATFSNGTTRSVVLGPETMGHHNYDVGIDDHLDKIVQVFDSQVAAKVNGELIYNADVLDGLRPHFTDIRPDFRRKRGQEKIELSLRYVERSLSPDERSKQFKKIAGEVWEEQHAEYRRHLRGRVQHFIEQYVENLLIIQKMSSNVMPQMRAAIDRRIDHEFATRREVLKSQLGVESDAELEAVLKSSGTSLEKVGKHFGIERRAMEYLALHASTDKSAVDESGISEYYSNNTELFTGTFAKIQVLAISKSDVFDAAERIKQIRTELLNRSDDDIVKPNVGIEGRSWNVEEKAWWSGQADRSPQLTETISTLPLNEWSDPIESVKEYLVIRVRSREEGVLAPIEVVREKIIQHLNEQHIPQKVREFRQKIFSEATIETDYKLKRFQTESRAMTNE